VLPLSKAEMLLVLTYSLDEGDDYDDDAEHSMYSYGWIGFIYKLLGYELVSFVKILTRRGKAGLCSSTWGKL
jgi:hypothetical protein